MTTRLISKPLTTQAFAEFGEVINLEGFAGETINYGNTEKFADLLQIDTAEEGGRTAMHLYRSQPSTLPLEIAVMERHPMGSQAFVPLHNRPFPVIVAAADAQHLGASTVRVFMSNGRQGVNLRRGTWHHYQVSLGQVCDYLVIDRAGPGDNFEEQRLEPALLLEVYSG
jgi:ureidoglycolate lyase